MKHPRIGYDDTKKMLNTLRNLNESKSSFKRITEQEETSEKKKNFLVINDVEVNLLYTSEEDKTIGQQEKDALSQLVDNIRQQVGLLVKLKPGFTINEKQARLDGSISTEGGDVGFVYIVGTEAGLYINSDMLKIDEHVIDNIEKLVKFQEVFNSTIEPIILDRETNV